MIRPFRLFATLAAVVALGLGVTARLVRAEPQAPAPAVAFKGAAPAATSRGPGGGNGDYQLDRLPIFSRVMLYVKDKYVDPSRFDPKQMLVAALEGVEKTVAEVMVQGDAKSPKLVLTVGAATRELDISGVKGVWEIRTVLGEAMGFIQEHLVAHKDLREIEYAAVNGMLSTLDPHTILLEPKFFKEMKLQTRGEFGGLGFVIAMRDGNLTVVKVLKNTPAQRAGIRAKDVITKIEEQSTINMDLQDAVDRLRGRPASKISITVQHASQEPRRLLLTREMISVETVPQARLLEGNVGYVRISQFSANTTRDLAAAIEQQRTQAGGKLAGLVLDLRGNPGGLLEQAIQVSDLFLSEGVIVKTVGEGGKENEVKEASADPSDLLNLPLIVLVNNSSASASEIVAGALKNNDRALIVGRQSFGKGSVQVLYDFSDPGRPGEEAALKLTIAQYLTPGDVSIQEVGITPDVALLPGRILREQVNMFAPPRAMGEADLDHHFQNASAQKAPGADRAAPAAPRTAPSPFELRYLLDEKEDLVAKQLRKDAREAAGAPSPHGADEAELTPEQVEDEETDADPDEFKADYQIRFARDLLRRAPTAFRRGRLLDTARPYVAERQGEEEGRVERRLRELGVDWSDGAAQAAGAPRAVVTVSPGPGKELHAGETANWTVTVENRGDAPFRRLRAWTSAEKNMLLDRREFVFGAIKPGEKRSWTVPVKLPRGMDSRHDEVLLHFADDGAKAPPDLTTSLSVTEVPRPAFAFSAQIDDAAGGNGDGLPQRGETFLVRVDVRNVGGGASSAKTLVTLKNLGDEKLFIKKGRDVIGALKPGGSKPATLEVELRRGSRSDTLPLRVTIYDERTDEYVQEKLDIPIAKDEPPRTAAAGAVRVEVAEAQLRSGASPSAPVIALARKGAVLPVDARVGDFYRVEWQKGRFAFAAEPDVKVGPAGARGGTIAEVWQREPPRIVLTPDPQKGAPVVDADHLRVSGSATMPASADPTARLRDVFVLVNDQKVFFKVQPDAASTPRMEFSTDVPLQPGNNVITIYAREDEDFVARRAVVVFRRPPSPPPQLVQDGRSTGGPPQLVQDGRSTGGPLSGAAAAPR